MQQPSVSVVMPAYNAAAYITRSVESVLQQDMPSWELWVVDDGSTDATAALVAELAARDARVQLVRGAHRGPGPARNVGIRHARAPWLAFLDADDLWLPGRLSHALEQARQHPDAHVLCGTAQWMDPTGRTGPMLALEGTHAGPTWFNRLLELNRLVLPGVTVRTQQVRLAGGFPEDPRFQQAEDYHLWLNLAARDCVFVGDPASHAVYRQHPAAATARASHGLAVTLPVVEDAARFGPVDRHVFHARLASLLAQLWTARLAEHTPGRWRDDVLGDPLRAARALRGGLLQKLPRASARAALRLMGR